MANLTICLIFSVLSAFTLKSIVKILVRDLMNSFFLLFSLNIPSNSTCMVFTRFSIKSREPSVESTSFLLLNSIRLNSCSISWNRETSNMLWKSSKFISISNFPFQIYFQIWLWHFLMKKWSFVAVFCVLFLLVRCWRFYFLAF